MKSRMFIYGFLTIFLCLGTSEYSVAESSSNNHSRYLKMLDEIIANREKYASDYHAKIAEARFNYNSEADPIEQYNALRRLYELYRTYRIDSAMIVAERRLDVAKITGEQAKIVSATLNLAEGYALSGNFGKAISILDTINDAILAEHQRKYRNSIYKTAYALQKETSLLSQDRMEALEMLRSLREKELKERDKNSRGYIMLVAEQLRDAGMTKEAAAKMDELQQRFDISDNAALLYMAGEINLEAGNEDKAIELLTQASILDLSAGSKEYRSLILLASELLKKGDVRRAFDYINLAFEDATFSKANLRTEEIMRFMPSIHKAFYDKERQVNRLTIIFLCISAFFIILLVIFVFLLVKAVRSNRKMIHTVEQINGKLKARNNDLMESDSVKLGILNGFMMDYSRYISRVVSFRKNIYRLIKTGQYDKAINAVRTDKVEAPDISAFQEMFDVAFLSMFPDFLEKLNMLLEKPIEQKESMRLSPEVRIAALMRLGITSTDQIVEMFHYSTQSVYNLRSSLRGMLKVSWEEFEEEIRKI